MAKRETPQIAKYENAKADYMRGELPVSQIAKKHNVSYTGLMAYAKKYNWKEQKERLAQEIQKQAVDIVQEWNEGDLAIAKALRSTALSKVRELGLYDKTGGRELSELAKVAEGAQRIARLAMGLNTASHEIAGRGGSAIEIKQDWTTEQLKEFAQRVFDKV